MPLHQKHTKGHICLSSAHTRGGACTRSTAVAPARAAHAPPIPSRARAAYLPAESELNVMSFYRKSLSTHLSDAQEPRNRVTRPHSGSALPVHKSHRKCSSGFQITPEVLFRYTNHTGSTLPVFKSHRKCYSVTQKPPEVLFRYPKNHRKCSSGTQITPEVFFRDSNHTGSALPVLKTHRNCSSGAQLTPEVLFRCKTHTGSALPVHNSHRKCSSGT
jgi:hypothetical protein